MYHLNEAHIYLILLLLLKHHLSFILCIPVHERSGGAGVPQAVDRLLLQWDAAYARLQAAEARFEAGGRTRRPTRRMGACGITGASLHGHGAQLGLPVQSCDVEVQELGIRAAPTHAVRSFAAPQAAMMLWRHRRLSAQATAIACAHGPGDTFRTLRGVPVA